MGKGRIAWTEARQDGQEEGEIRGSVWKGGDGRSGVMAHVKAIHTARERKRKSNTELEERRKRKPIREILTLE